jgi:CBS domain-containing protein
MDWVAFGLPVEKGQTGPSMVIEKLERQVPTCQLSDSVGEAKQRAQKLGVQICVVVNEQGKVLGLIEKEDWETDNDISVETAMDPGPTTLRPSYLLKDANELVVKSGGDAIVTSSDGKLMGIFRHKNAELKKQISKSGSRHD